MRYMVAILVLLAAIPARAFEFDNIDGGTLALSDWRGQPVLVVNTASRCGFTKQYDGLQDLQDRFQEQGLVVLAVPSNDFRQELASADKIKEFCEVNFGLDLPMTTITRVTGPSAHPFYQWVRETTGFSPAWNFNKVLLDRNGKVAATFGATARPLSRPILDAVETTLAK